MRRGLLLLSIFVTALAVAPAATADKPIREVIPAPDDRIIDDQCSFPVLGHIEGDEIDTTFTDRFGNPIRLLGVFPGNRLTLTNLETDESITVGATGSFQLRANPDGTAAAMVTGQGVWLGHPVTGEPGIWFQSGSVSAALDADGNATSVDVTGRLVDLCPRLAS